MKNCERCGRQNQHPLEMNKKKDPVCEGCKVKQSEYGYVKPTLGHAIRAGRHRSQKLNVRY